MLNLLRRYVISRSILTLTLLELTRPTRFQVRRLKEQICEVEGIQAEQIRIVMKGRQLKDEKSLNECKVSAKTKVSIVLSLRGGFA